MAKRCPLTNKRHNPQAPALLTSPMHPRLQSSALNSKAKKLPPCESRIHLLNVAGLKRMLHVDSHSYDLFCTWQGLNFPPNMKRFVNSYWWLEIPWRCVFPKYNRRPCNLTVSPLKHPQWRHSGSSRSSGWQKITLKLLQKFHILQYDSIMFQLVAFQNWHLLKSQSACLHGSLILFIQFTEFRYSNFVCQSSGRFQGGLGWSGFFVE